MGTFTLCILIILSWLFVVRGVDLSPEPQKKTTNSEKVKEIEQNLPNYATGNSSTTGGLPYGAALQDPKNDSNTSSTPAYRENRGANRN